MPWLSHSIERGRRVMRRLRPTENLLLKVGSLLAALLIWVTVASEEKVPFDRMVPVEVANLAEGLAEPRDVPGEVRVKLRGRPSLVRKLNPGDVGPVTLDLGRAPPGPHLALLEAEKVRVPFGLEVVALEPAHVELLLERVLQKDVPIVPNLSGAPPLDFEVKSREATPPTALVSGAESAVAAVREATTVPIPLEGRRAPFTVHSQVFVGQPEVRVLEPREVRLRIVVEERIFSRTLDAPVEVTGRAEGRVTWNPKVLPVTVRGRSSLVRALTGEDLYVSVPVEGLTPRREDYRIEPQVVFREPERFEKLEVTGLGQSRIDVHIFMEGR